MSAEEQKNVPETKPIEEDDDEVKFEIVSRLNFC